MSRLVQIFAVGGGGFTHSQDGGSSDALLEDRLLALAGPVEQIRIGYIGHANNDNPDRIKAFYARFAACARTAHLPLTADASAAREFLHDLHILYVGGGTTTAMLSHWHSTGIADLLQAAMRQGLIASGVSAGAICWFTDLLLGTEEDGFDHHQGLGLVPGSACPHFSSEPVRKQAFEAAIASTQLQPGIAIDDGVGVHIIDGVVAGIAHARAMAGTAHRVEPDGDTVAVRPLKAGFRLGTKLMNGENT